MSKQKTYKRNPLALFGVAEKDHGDHYQARVVCRNCKNEHLLYFKKGLQIYMHRCPICEVQFLNSDIKQ